MGGSIAFPYLKRLLYWNNAGGGGGGVGMLFLLLRTGTMLELLLM